MPDFRSHSDFHDASITVMGLGRFGGGVGVTRFLAHHGAQILLTDQAPEAELADSLAQIHDLIRTGRVRLRLGEHNVADFTTPDLVIANPAVTKPWENRFLRAAAAAGIPILTEIQLLYHRLPAHNRVVAVTGSVGKSTTTAMIHHALARAADANPSLAPRVHLGGNIGGSLLSALHSISPIDLVVLELSSAMLFWLARDPAAPLSSDPALPRAGLLPPPAVALVTNISENHLDWHGSFDHYAACKQSLLTALPPSAAAILNDSSVHPWASLTRARVLKPNPSNFHQPMLLPGEHNRSNAAAALEACSSLLSAPPDSPLRTQLEHAIASFPGLAHRLQLVCQRPALTDPAGSIRCYNDSKSTTPESCLKALHALAAVLPKGLASIHLIAGGYDKKISLDPVAQISPALAGIYTIGATGPSLARSCLSRGAAVTDCSTLERAVAAALSRALPGDALLLSPASASWDQYINFEARGEEFIRLVAP